MAWLLNLEKWMKLTTRKQKHWWGWLKKNISPLFCGWLILLKNVIGAISSLIFSSYSSGGDGLIAVMEGKTLPKRLTNTSKCLLCALCLQTVVFLKIPLKRELLPPFLFYYRKLSDAAQESMKNTTDITNWLWSSSASKSNALGSTFSEVEYLQ